MALLVYMTAASADEAERIAGDLVESRLAACVNVMAPIRSVYSWKGELCRSEEIPFIAKTDDDRFEALAARVRALHSYETPCIVALPVARGDADFLAWITESTHPFMSPVRWLSTVSCPLTARSPTTSSPISCIF